MNIETMIAYVVGLASCAVVAFCSYFLGMAHGIARAERKEARDE